MRCKRIMQNENDDTFEVFYANKSYNIEKFLKNHPGGKNYLTPYKKKDVSKRMDDTNHSKAAYYLFKEYDKEGRRNSFQENDNNEDLEKLVDWSKPMLAQVGNLGIKYKEWVISPVDRELRLFGNFFLEYLSITPWYVVPIVWIPVIMYLIKLGAEKYIQFSKNPQNGPAILFYLIMGVLLWGLLEYSLHRWVFHIEPSGKSQLMIYFHFVIHGLHHKVPFDTRRLVFPPFPAALITLFLYKLISFIVPQYCIILILAGGLLGYVIYDMIHYYLHYGSPNENSYFYNLKRYHNQHHFAHPDSGFGISSTFWDKVFGTVIKLRNLKMHIKW